MSRSDYAFVFPYHVFYIDAFLCSFRAAPPNICGLALLLFSKVPKRGAFPRFFFLVTLFPFNVGRDGEEVFFFPPLHLPPIRSPLRTEVKEAS